MMNTTKEQILSNFLASPQNIARVINTLNESQILEILANYQIFPVIKFYENEEEKLEILRDILYENIVQKCVKSYVLYPFVKAEMLPF